MANYSTEGIIIKVRDFIEADKIVKILSKDKGIFEAIAKGAKKLTSRKSSNIEFLNSGKFLLATGKNLHILLEVKLEDDYQSRINPNDINYFFYFAEVVDKTLVETDKRLYQKIKSLRKFFPQNIKQTLLALQLLLLSNLGVIPNLKNCLKCDSFLDKNRYVVPNQIGYFCKKHGGDFHEISDREIKIQLFFLSNNSDITQKINVDKEYKFLLELHNSWIENTIERKINSYKLLEL